MMTSGVVWTLDELVILLKGLPAAVLDLVVSYRRWSSRVTSGWGALSWLMLLKAPPRLSLAGAGERDEGVAGELIICQEGAVAYGAK